MYKKNPDSSYLQISLVEAMIWIVWDHLNKPEQPAKILDGVYST